MKLEIFKNNKQIKPNKVKLVKPDFIDINFSSINKLKGNKTILDYSFMITKKELLND